jgi:glutathione S-transferase
MIKVYGSVMSRGSRTLWVLEELGVPYEIVSLDFRKGEHKAPAFLAINPAGKMPALTDGDVVMSESLAMNLYVAKRYGQGKLWPADEAGQAKVLQWTLWAATELEPVSYGMLREVAFKKPEERDASVIAGLGERAKPLLDLLESCLTGQHLMGGGFNLADLQVACVLDYCTRSEFSLAPWPKVASWHAACQARPAYQRVQDLRTAAMKAA